MARANVSRLDAFVGAHQDRLRRRPARSVARTGELLVASARSSRSGHRARWQAAGPPDQPVTAEVARRGHPGVRRQEERDRQDSVWRIARRPDRYRWRTARATGSAEVKARESAAEPQHSSTITGCGGASRSAWRSSSSVRRRGTNTPGSTAIRSPANSAHPTICSSGVPVTRCRTILRVRAVWSPWSAIPLPRLRRIHSRPAEAVRQAPGGQAPLAAPAQSSFSCSARNFSNSAPISSALGTRSGRSA